MVPLGAINSPRDRLGDLRIIEHDDDGAERDAAPRDRSSL